MTAPSPIQRTVLAELKKTTDIIVHVSHARLGDVQWLDIRDFCLSTGLYQRGVTLPWSDIPTRPGKSKPATPVNTTYPNPVNCRRCGNLIAFAETKVPIRAQCTDPECLATQPASRHEDRDSAIELMYAIGMTPELIAEAVGITRQGVVHILS